MKVKINNHCVGCGLCAETCPEVFEMASDNVAVVRVSTISSELEKACREAASNCPVDAIEIPE